MLKKMLRYFMLPLLLLLSNSSGNSAPQGAQSDPAGFNAGPDIIAGNMADLYVAGVTGTQNGLAIGVTSCDAGNEVVNFFAMPNTNHPAIAQNLYRMSGGSGNNDRFEQIGQAWVKHTYGAEQANACNFGCLPGGDFNHLGVGCSDTYFAFQSAQQGDLGSRAWINPFTGIFQSNARDHTGHIHTAVSHMMVVERNDLDTTMNPGATYYAELLYVTPDEYAWCQVHSGECNMSNNASYRPYSVTGTTSFTFSAAGATVPMSPAMNAWTGATINPIEPQPGVDGRAFIAWKVTGPVAGVWHYEYALYNQNLDRAIQSFSVPLGCGVAVNNLGFHAPPNHPGFPNDGTLGDAGFSNAVWTSNQTSSDLSWSSETFAQNQNANAIRWGTLYNFRFDSNRPPQAANATIGFFKTGTPITVGIQGPSPDTCNGTPTPTATATPTATPSTTPTPTTPPIPTPTTTPTPIPTPTPTPTPTPAAQALNLSTRMRVETGDSVGIGGFIITGSGPKHVLLRAIGPSLAQFGVPDVLADPVLELHGPGGFVTITDDNWRDDPVQEAAILADGIPPTNELESAIDANLNPGAYTAVVRGNNNTSGVALVEVYDLDQAALSKLGNISTRAFVSTGDNIVIAGFILGNGAGNDTIVVRGLSLLSGAFDPTLDLRDADGNLIAYDNDWQDDPAQAAELIALGLAPPNNLDAAIVATFPPGLYTALLAGRNGGTGIGLVEVYDNVVIGPKTSPTPAGTPTPTPSATPTVTPSATPTATPTGTPSPTPTPTPTPSSTPTPSATPTSTVTPTPSEGSPTATATATATASPTPSTPTPTPSPCPFTVFPENFDGVTTPALPPCWTTDGTGNGILWVTSTSTPDTTPNCAFIDDQDGISDKSLYSPGLAVCSPSAQLSFRNYFNTEFSDGTYWDGGVLEVSSPNINGGAFTDITDPAVGGSFVSGGYTGEISGIAGNPLAGRMAWSGDSGGYIDTVVNLGPNVNGQTIQLRFRMGTDEVTAAPGWRIDTITMVGGGPCPTPSPTPMPTSTPSPPGALWYNGDFDGVNALANEQDTGLGSGQFARVYDNFSVTGDGWNVTEVFSHNLENTNVTGATWEIRSGTTLLSTGGTLVANGTTATPRVTFLWCDFSFCEYEIKVTGLNLFLPVLPAGQFYWLNVTPIGDGTGRSWDSDTTGANCIGTPCGNDGNAFFDSNFFGVTFGSTADQGQPGDFSMGVHGTVFGAPTPTPTPTPTPGTPTPTPSPSPTPVDTIWYNGDFDGVNGLANERDTSLGSGQFASVYDNFNVTGGGWSVTAVFSDNLENTVITGATWEIRSGSTLLSTGGTLVASGMTAVPAVIPTGRNGFGYTEYQVKVTGLHVFLPVLPAGQFYWLNVTPIGDGSGRSFDSAITNGIGANCVGTPCGNDQNAFFDSNFFGVNFGSTVDQGQPYDYSMGVNGFDVGMPTPTPKP